MKASGKCIEKGTAVSLAISKFWFLKRTKLVLCVLYFALNSAVTFVFSDNHFIFDNTIENNAFAALQ